MCCCSGLIPFSEICVRIRRELEQLEELAAKAYMQQTSGSSNLNGSSNPLERIVREYSGEKRKCMISNANLHVYICTWRDNFALKVFD